MSHVAVKQVMCHTRTHHSSCWRDQQQLSHTHVKESCCSWMSHVIHTHTHTIHHSGAISNSFPSHIWVSDVAVEWAMLQLNASCHTHTHTHTYHSWYWHDQQQLCPKPSLPRGSRVPIHSYVWHDSFMCVTWLVHMGDTTHSYVWHVCDMTHSYVWHVCDMTHSYVWHVCDTTHSYVWHVCDTTHSYVWHMCDMTHTFFTEGLTSTHSCVWNESLICVTWLVHVCNATYSCVTWLIHICSYM